MSPSSWKSTFQGVIHSKTSRLVYSERILCHGIKRKTREVVDVSERGVVPILPRERE